MTDKYKVCFSMLQSYTAAYICENIKQRECNVYARNSKSSRSVPINLWYISKNILCLKKTMLLNRCILRVQSHVYNRKHIHSLFLSLSHTQISLSLSHTHTITCIYIYILSLYLTYTHMHTQADLSSVLKAVSNLLFVYGCWQQRLSVWEKC